MQLVFMTDMQYLSLIVICCGDKRYAIIIIIVMFYYIGDSYALITNYNSLIISSDSYVTNIDDIYAIIIDGSYHV